MLVQSDMTLLRRMIAGICQGRRLTVEQLACCRTHPVLTANQQSWGRGVLEGTFTRRSVKPCSPPRLNPHHGTPTLLPASRLHRQSQTHSRQAYRPRAPCARLGTLRFFVLRYTVHWLVMRSHIGRRSQQPPQSIPLLGAGPAT